MTIDSPMRTSQCPREPSARVSFSTIVASNTFSRKTSRSAIASTVM
jgi:hypothetical protein